MTNVFTTSPICVNVVQVKHAHVSKKYVFIGTVPKPVEKELVKIQTEKRVPEANPLLQNFYGINWKDKLSVSYLTGDKKKTSALVKTKPSRKKGGEDDDIDFSEPDGDFGEVDAEFSFDTEEKSEKSVKKINITDDELDRLLEEPEESLVGVVDDIFNVPESNKDDVKLSAVTETQLTFIFDDPHISVYPFDKISEFKKKIYVVTGIPMYRQHVWFVNKSVSLPLSYSVSVGGTSVPVNIRKISSWYKEGKLIDTVKQIENIPLDIDLYNANVRIKIEARDNFKIMEEYYNKYDATEFNVVDINEFIPPNNRVLSDSILKNKQQTNLVYYGFVILYWPMLTMTAFRDYLKGESNIANFYPDLCPNIGVIKEIFAREKNVIDVSLDLHTKSKEKDLGLVKSSVASSITSAIMNVSYVSNLKEKVVFVRNLFDKIELSDSIDACRCFTNNEDKSFILDKVYKNAEPIKELLISQGIVFRLVSPDIEPVTVIFYKNGNYIIKSRWRDEQNYDFDSIFKEVKKLVDPLVNRINKMAPFVLYEGKQISHISKFNTKFVEIGMNIYYKKVFTESQFAFLKFILEEFRAAGLMDGRNIEKNYAEYYFRKGMYQFDSRRIEKVSNIKNYYEYMSDGVIKQKWFNIFEKTRITKIWHRFSDIKIEIYGVKEKEFNILSDLILALFHMYETRKKGTVEEYEFKKIMKKKARKALTNLKEQDPVLYDFKKMYKSNRVYSRICQKSYQPLLINKMAFDKMPEAQKGKVVKYWNFTTETDAYYHCPNPKYPYIKFFTKNHPKDYCIPCCKKIDVSSNADDPKKIIHEICMKEHAYTKEKKTITTGSKYIMAYGKDVEAGRLSKLPEDSMEGIFYETFSMEHGSSDQSYMTSDGFYMYGTNQNTASISNVGYIYSLSHALDMDISKLIDEIVVAIKKNPGIFNILLKGRITNYVPDYNILIQHLLAFKNNEAEFVSNEIEKMPWNKLFMDLAFSYLDVNTILFQNTKEAGSVELRLPNGLEDVSDYILKSKKNIIVLQKVDKYYPIYLINTDLFFKLGIIEKKIFMVHDGIVKIIEGVVKKYIKTIQIKGKTYSKINLIIVKEFLASEHMKVKYSIHKLFINHSNYCYGVQFLNSTKNTYVYIPVEQSYYSFDAKGEGGGSDSLEFAPYMRSKAEHTQTFDELMFFINDFNKWVDIQTVKAQISQKDHDIYPVIRVDSWIVLQKSLDFQKTDKVIGFRSSNLNYYFSDMDHSEAVKKRRVKSMPMLYDPDKINELIHKKEAPKPDKRTENLSKILYKYNAYQLFLLEFLNVFSKNQNVTVRTQLKKLLLGDFIKTMGVINVKLREMVADTEDLLKVRMQLSDYINNHHDRKQLFLDIDNSAYNFDKVIIHRLMDMDIESLKKELKKISKGFVKIGEIPSNIVFPNMFSSCGAESGEQYCKGSSLILSQDRYDTYINIIANDILNPLKQKWIFSDIMSDRVVEFLQFVNRPNESIYVTLTSAF